MDEHVLQLIYHILLAQLAVIFR